MRLRATIPPSRRRQRLAIIDSGLSIGAGASGVASFIAGFNGESSPPAVALGSSWILQQGDAISPACPVAMSLPFLSTQPGGSTTQVPALQPLPGGS